MTKYYKVIKDHPLFEVGAIVYNEDDTSQYVPINRVWYKELRNINMDDFYECQNIVENSKDFFEEVYPIGNLKKMMFGNKKQAQAAAAALYKS